MKHFEEKTTTRTSRLLVSKTCDLCGAKAIGTHWDSAEWGHAFDDINENKTVISISIKQRDGWSCPDGGSGTEYSIDLCPSCFKARLVPWLQSQGADIRQEDWDW